MTMNTVAAVGARADVCGLALAGVDVVFAEDPDAVRRAWRALPATVGLVILTTEAARALGDTATAVDPARLTVVMP
ncbi:V-type ATP synthase subunit F [Streptomyces sp. MMS24-I2-30]|uniref:V-type ATP synthase subunit F n=1 Tax=Streptomyces sp. MMS24-I2-30 TaxID=3351564 RepID=UPI0038968EEA